MKVPRLTKSGRTGWNKEIGRVLLHANWSGSWDGWGVTSNDGRRVTYKLACLEPFVATYGYGVSLTLWKLVLRVGVATTIPQAQSETAQ